MNDHETVLVEKKRQELIVENRQLEEELYRRMPLGAKIHTHIFAVLHVGAIFFGVWLVGYMIYTLLKSARIF